MEQNEKKKVIWLVFPLLSELQYDIASATASCGILFQVNQKKKKKTFPFSMMYTLIY